MAVVPVGMMWPQAKGQWPPLKTRRGRKDFAQNPRWKRHLSVTLFSDFQAIQAEDKCLMIQAIQCAACCNSHLHGVLGRCMWCTLECGAPHGPLESAAETPLFATVRQCYFLAGCPKSNQLSRLNNSRQMRGFVAFCLQGTSSLRLINEPCSVLSRERAQVLQVVWKSTFQNCWRKNVKGIYMNTSIESQPITGKERKIKTN